MQSDERQKGRKLDEQDKEIVERKIKFAVKETILSHAMFLDLREKAQEFNEQTFCCLLIKRK